MLDGSDVIACYIKCLLCNTSATFDKGPLLGIGNTAQLMGFKAGRSHGQKRGEHDKVHNSRVDAVDSANGIRRRGQSAFELSVVRYWGHQGGRLRLFDPRAMRSRR